MKSRTPDMPLTDRQQRLLDLLIANEHRTVRELQTLTGTSSTSVVMYNLLVLERLGHIVRGAQGCSRGWRVSPALRRDPAARVVELARFWAAHDARLAEAIREYENQ